MAIWNMMVSYNPTFDNMWSLYDYWMVQGISKRHFQDLSLFSPLPTINFPLHSNFFLISSIELRITKHLQPFGSHLAHLLRETWKKSFLTGRPSRHERSCYSNGFLFALSLRPATRKKISYSSSVIRFWLGHFILIEVPSRSILSSTSISPTYMKAINSAEDLLLSELDLYCVDAAAYFLSTSPTTSFKKLMKQITIFQYEEVPHVLERLENFIPGFRVILGLSCVIGPLGRQGPAATFGQHCPQMTRRPGTMLIIR